MAQDGEREKKEQIMPYAKHDTFQFPADPNAKIWRYMDFTKVVSILENNALYFPRFDHLEDPFECSIPVATWNRFANTNLPFFSFMKNHSQLLYANCWHCNEYESAAMWRLYLKSDEGIAIQSTAIRFAESFRKYPDDIFIGTVSYIDYDTQEIDSNNTFAYAMHKRMSFQHENEIRAVTVCWEEGSAPGKRAMSFTPGPIGLSIPVILDQLVEAVYVAPTAQTWLVELVQAIMNRYGQKAPVIHSSLADKPPQ